jgi:hypothetical protein
MSDVDVYYDVTLGFTASSSYSNKQGFLGLRNDSLRPDNVSMLRLSSSSMTKIHMPFASHPVSSLITTISGTNYFQSVDRYSRRLLARRFLSSNKVSYTRDVKPQGALSAVLGNMLLKKSYKYNLHTTLDRTNMFDLSETVQRHHRSICIKAGILLNPPISYQTISAVAKAFQFKLNNERMAGL